MHADRPEQATPDQLAMTGLIGSKVRFGWEHPADVVPAAIQEAAALARTLGCGGRRCARLS